MIPMNEAYGNAASLRDYCQADKSAPIWGEIQHSLWLNNLNKANERRSRLFPKLFTWNSILDFEKSIAIGDPMGYFLKLNPPELNKNPQDIILMPKFRRALSVEDRIAQYKNFMNEAIERFPGAKLVISIHPEELKYRQRIITKEFSKIEIYDPSDIANPMIEYVNLLANAKTIFTDYLGVHVFRAISYFELRSEYSVKTWENPLIDEKIKTYFENFLFAQSYGEAKRISDKLLGLDHLRSSEELTKLLGYSKFKCFIGKILRKPYINYSQRTLK